MHAQRMYTEHHHRPATIANESLADRVLRIGKTIVDLRRKLAAEREMLEKERMIAASMFLLPTTNEYYTLKPPRATNSERIQEYDDIVQSPEPRFQDDEFQYNPGLTSSEVDFIQREKNKVVRSQVQQYRKHLKQVEKKCKYELGAVKESIYNLKKVSTELSLDMMHERHRNSEDDKDFFYD